MAQQPPKYKTAIMIWVVIYPTINILMLLIGNALNELVLPLRTLVLTMILVPLMVYVLLPFANKLFQNWLSK